MADYTPDKKLDGSETAKDLLTPFDAHDQRVRGTHVPTTKDSPDPDPATIQEYPKAIAHDEDTGEPVIAKNAEHEAQLKKAAQEAEKASA